MSAARINWPFFGGCAAVGLMLTAAYIVGDLYGPNVPGSGDDFDFTDAEREHALFLCKSEIDIDTREQIAMCMGEELMAGRLLDSYLTEYPDAITDGCKTMRVLIGNRVALNCAMGRTGKTKKAAADPDASTSI